MNDPIANFSSSMYALAVCSVLVIAGLAALRAGRMQPSQAEAAEAPAPVPFEKLPPLDREAPKDFETATFALG